MLDADLRRRVLVELERTPLALYPRYLGGILAMLEGRLSAAALNAQVVRPAAIAPPARIAVIPIVGPIFGRETADFFGRFGLSVTSAEGIRNAFRGALASADVDGIFFDIASPGGEVEGIADLAEEISAARTRRPMGAVANEAMFSAAYWLGAGVDPDHLSLAWTGGVGSIGVLAVHVDESKFNERLGFGVTVVKSGEKKDQFSPFKPLSDDARAELQAEVDRIARRFETHVAQARGLSAETVRGFQAGTFQGEAAVTVGLADRVETAESALRRFAERITGTRGRVAAPQGGRAMAEATGTEAAATASNVVPITEARKEGAAAERKRAETIRGLCAASRLSKDKAVALAEKLVSAGTPLEDVYNAITTAVAEAASTEQVSGLHGGPAAQSKTKLMSGTELFAKRAAELDEARSRNPIIKRIHAIA